MHLQRLCLEQTTKKVILIMYLINPRYLGVVKAIDILYHVYILYVTNLGTENHLEYR